MDEEEAKQENVEVEEEQAEEEYSEPDFQDTEVNNKKEEVVQTSEDKINSLAKSLRPSSLNRKEDYFSTDSHAICFLFFQSFIFLEKLFNFIAEDGEMKEKIRQKLDENKEIFLVIAPLLLNYESLSILKKYKIKSTLKNILINKSGSINSFLEFSYPIGKESKFYDADIHGGIIND